MKILNILVYLLIIQILLGVSSCSDAVGTNGNNSEPPSITMSSTTATMEIGTKRVFNAEVKGLNNKNVLWSILPPQSDAKIEQTSNNNVIFTAPTIAGIIKLNATSVESPALSGIVEITVVNKIETEGIFDNWNIAAVQSGPTNPTVFTIDRDRTITYVNNYHYFNRGELPGTISFKHSDGTTYGPWKCVGTTGQGGVVNANWVCYPNIVIKAGTYTVIDSHPPTWSHNSGSKNCGFTRISALK